MIEGDVISVDSVFRFFRRLPRAVGRRARNAAQVLVRRCRSVLGVVVARVRSTPHAVATALRHTAWRAEVLRYVILGFRLDTVAGTIPSAGIPLVMCLWNRPHRFASTLRQLSEQVGAPPIRLILWNNKPSATHAYLEDIAQLDDTGAIASIELHSSRRNIGGIARFIVARRVTRRGSAEPFLMLDDDIDISPSFVRDLLQAWRPGTYAGFWAFVILGSYWERREPELQEQVDYVGTGGSVCDSSVAHDMGFFTRIPARYGFIEDLWLSAYAASRGWRLRKVDTPFTLTSEDSNQYLALFDTKPLFWDYLRTRLERGRPL